MRTFLGHVLDCIYFMTLTNFFLLLLLLLYIHFLEMFTLHRFIDTLFNGNYSIFFFGSKKVALLALLVLF